MALNNIITAGLTVGIIVAIIMSSAALFMLVNLNDKLDAVISHEQYENMIVGAPGIYKNEFYIFTQELDADEEAIGVPVGRTVVAIGPVLERGKVSHCLLSGESTTALVLNVGLCWRSGCISL